MFALGILVTPPMLVLFAWTMLGDREVDLSPWAINALFWSSMVGSVMVSVWMLG